MDIHAFLYPTAPTSKQALLKTATGATATAFLIWLANKPFFIPMALVAAGVYNLPKPEQYDCLQKHTLRPLLMGAYFASILCGSHYAWKAAHLASSLLPRLVIPTYYSLPVFANTWMLIAYARQIQDEKNH
jgi:hypothetical protein